MKIPRPLGRGASFRIKILLIDQKLCKSVTLYNTIKREIDLEGSVCRVCSVKVIMGSRCTVKMFVPKTIHHYSKGSACGEDVPDVFELICWNVHKKNRKEKRFQTFLQQEISRADLHFILLQEAIFPTGRCSMEGFCHDAAANLAFKDRHYGVLSASRSRSLDAKALLSEKKEVLIGTHKSLLVTRYRMRSGGELLVVNLHAINFRESGAFGKESERLYDVLCRYKGALIVAGDFNTWHPGRYRAIMKVSRDLGLSRVPLGHSEGVKSVFGMPLDMIFYRGLHPERYSVLDDGGISDHRPIRVRFSLDVPVNTLTRR